MAYTTITIPTGGIMNNHFPWKQFLKQVAVIAIPVAVQNLLTTTGSMIDTIMLAALGQQAVAAVGLCAQFSSLMFSCYWGFVGGGMLFFAQYWGAQDHEGIKRSYGLTLTCMLSVGILFCLLGLLAPQLVMQMYTDKTAIQAISVEYLRIVCFAYPLQVLSMAMSALLRTTERVKLPLYGAICSVLTNMVLNWMLIGGHWGAPALGIHGAAIATVCAAAVNVIVISLLAVRNGHPYIFAIRSHFRWSREMIRAYFVKCAPILANEFLIGVGMMGINIVLGHQSEEALAATAVFRTLEGLIIGFFAGFSNAASILVGAEVGAGNLTTAFRRAWRLVYLCMGVICAVIWSVIVVHRPLLTIMSLSGESLQLGFGMLLIFGIAVVIRMGNWTQNDTYRSAGDARYGTILEIVFMFAMVLPCVFLTGWILHTHYLIVFACCFIDEPIRFFLMQRHMYSGKWIKPVTPEGAAALPGFRTELERGVR